MADSEKPVSAPAEPEQPSARRPRWRRFALGGLALVVAVVAGLLVSFLTVDLGPNLRARAERQGTNYMHRPLHIGRLSARLIPGVFQLDDVVIDGLQPSDRPFLTAKTITVALPWWTIVSRKLRIESVEMTDWDMLVEQWPSSPEFPNGRHSFPKVTPDSTRTGPAPFTTTLQWMLASRGTFRYEDHGAPWSTAARGLRIRITRGPADTFYRGTASFTDATIAIQRYEPFRASMQSQFGIEGSKVHFTRIDMVSDGARSVMTGDIEMARWPEQTYQIRSLIEFPVQKEVFFHGQKFAVSGRGDFQGTFHLFKGGRELKGTFTSPMAGVLVGGHDWRFPHLRGSVLWVPDRLDITDTTCGLLGGTARFEYRLAPFGNKDVPTRAIWDVSYRDVDLATLTDFFQTLGLRLDGRATGRNRLEWPLGTWASRTGRGEVTAQAPEGTRVMTRELQPDAVAEQLALPPEAGPFNPQSPLGYLPIVGHVAYTLDPAWIVLDHSWTATPKTYVSFEGRTAYGDRSAIPFHVTSLDWQESDRVLAGIMTAFGSPTGAVPVGGVGEFDGVMLNAFSRPRIEGTFTGDGMRAWDVDWGRGRATLVIEDSYVIISESTITTGDAAILADGKFSLGFPRKDNGEEINARIRMSRRPMADLRHAFQLDTYPVTGRVSGLYHLYGKYQTPDGYGTLTIDEGVAYGEPFQTATASLRFERTGVRLDAMDIRKSTGTVTGAAWVGWDGTYSFNADGARMPVESLTTAVFPPAPLSGVLQFTAAGAGTFLVPRYDVRLRVDDLYAGDEGVGQLSGRLGLRGDLLTVALEAASPRLVASGSGTIALTEQMDADLTLRFTNTSLDPYLRFFEPRLSPFTTAVAGGTVRVVGELADVDHLVVDATVDDLDLTLFDYRVRNDGPIELSLNQHVAEVGRLRLVGEGTKLEVTGQVGLHDSTIAVQASGDANLGLLQGFYRDIRSSGAATLKADISGPLSKPVFSGSATIHNGRVRELSLPHSLDGINGQLSFDAAGIRIDDVNATLAGGDVAFGGRVAMTGFAPGDLNLTAIGQQMRIRYPEGFVSTIDADLSLRGKPSAMVLGGTVTVHDALYSKRFDPAADLFSLTGSTASPLGGGAAPVSTLPVRFDIQITAPSSLRIENNLARVVASADLKLQGTYDRPLLFGRAVIERGDVTFEGNRYLVTRGSIDFTNPARIEPFFDIEAETRVRVPGETYRVTLGFTGTTSRMSKNLNSDPPLSDVGIVLLLLGQTADVQNAELRGLNPGLANRSEEDLLKAAGARLLTGGLSAPVNRVVEQTLGVDLQITPSIGSQNDPLTPSARFIIGKRISNRAYLTFTRALGTASRDQIVVLEYDQNDRVGWVLTQNSVDRTYSIEFRVRRSF